MTSSLFTYMNSAKLDKNFKNCYHGFYRRPPDGRTGLALCLAGTDSPLENLENGYLEWRGLRLKVSAAQPICIGDMVSHWWAILTVEDV